MSSLNISNMRIVYMGTPDFAVEPLRQLINAGVELAAVVTVPDKPAGRGQKLQQSAVKQFALQNNLPVLQPVRLRDEEFIKSLQILNADLFIVVAFRMLPEVVWSIPSKGTINLHASLLPQYRGAAPINWAIINGETYTGVSTFFITHEIDTGNILLQNKVDIKPNETAGELHDNLMDAGAKLLVNTLKKIEEKDIEPIPQPYVDNLKKAPKLFKQDCKINWSADIHNINNLIRGLSPYPAAWSEMVLAEERLGIKIYKSEIEEKQHELTSGTIVSDNKTYMKVACNNGFIHITELQLHAKKKLAIRDFLAGFKRLNDFVFD